MPTGQKVYPSKTNFNCGGTPVLEHRNGFSPLTKSCLCVLAPLPTGRLCLPPQYSTPTTHRPKSSYCLLPTQRPIFSTPPPPGQWTISSPRNTLYLKSSLLLSSSSNKWSFFVPSTVLGTSNSDMLLYGLLP